MGSSINLNEINGNGDFDVKMFVWYQTSPEHEIVLDFNDYTARLKILITYKDVAYDGKVIFAGRESWHTQTTWDWRKKKMIRFEKKGGLLKLFLDDDGL